MIIEFIGASGAGKSTLVTDLAQHPSGDYRSAWEVTLGSALHRRVSHPTVRNLIAEARVLTAVAGSRQDHRALNRFAASTLRSHARSHFERINFHRSIYRKLGMHELSRRSGGHVLADEGTLLIAYYLFVYARGPIRHSDLDRFAELVPLPDRVIHVRAPVEELLERAERRSDRRRELTGVTSSELRRWIERATEVFDYLASLTPIRERTLTIDSVDNSGDDSRIAKVASFISQAEVARARSAPGGGGEHA